MAKILPYAATLAGVVIVTLIMLMPVGTSADSTYISVSDNNYEEKLTELATPTFNEYGMARAVGGDLPSIDVSGTVILIRTAIYGEPVAETAVAASSAAAIGDDVVFTQMSLAAAANGRDVDYKTVGFVFDRVYYSFDNFNMNILGNANLYYLFADNIAAADNMDNMDAVILITGANYTLEARAPVAQLMPAFDELVQQASVKAIGFEGKEIQPQFLALSK